MNTERCRLGGKMDGTKTHTRAHTRSCFFSSRTNLLWLDPLLITAEFDIQTCLWLISHVRLSVKTTVFDYHAAVHALAASHMRTCMQVKISFSGTGEAAFTGVALFAHPDVACRCEAGYYLDVASAPVRVLSAGSFWWDQPHAEGSIS